MPPLPAVKSDTNEPMHSEFSRINANLSAALETVNSKGLNKASIIMMLLSPIIGVSSVTDLDYIFTAWTLAGGIAGTSMALAWRKDGEMVRIVVGRATFALSSGVCTPPMLNHFFPWLADLTKNPMLLFMAGGLSALCGFVFGYGVFHVFEKRQERISTQIAQRIGVDLRREGDDNRP